MRDASASNVGLFKQCWTVPGRALICGQIDGVACFVVLDRQTAVASLLESLFVCFCGSAWTKQNS
jgi:hypothetical protein